MAIVAALPTGKHRPKISRLSFAGLCSVPAPGVMKSAVPGSCTRAVCHTPAGLTTASPGLQRDDVLDPVEILDEVDPARQEHHYLLTGGVALPRIPSLGLRRDADQTALVAIGREALPVALETLGRPREVGQDASRGPETEVDEGT